MTTFTSFLESASWWMHNGLELAMTDQTTNALQVYQFWLPKVRLPVHAWAWLGNAAGETSFLLHPVGDHDQAFGLAQWHAPRMLAIKAATGIDIRTASLADQLAAVAWEVSPKGPYRHVAPNLDATDTLEAGIGVLVRQFEQSASPATDVPKRVADALYWQKTLSALVA